MKPEQLVRQFPKAGFQKFGGVTLISSIEGETLEEMVAIFVTETGQKATFHRVFNIKDGSVTEQLPHFRHLHVALKELILKPVTQSLQKNHEMEASQPKETHKARTESYLPDSATLTRI